MTMSRSFDDSNQVQDEVEDVNDESNDEVNDVKDVENEDNIIDEILDRLTSTEFIRLLNIEPDKRLETLTHHYRASIKTLDSQSVDKLDKLNMRSENDPVSREIHTEKVEDKSEDIKNLKIIIIGPPVSGKTTLARKLAEHYGLVHLEYKLIVQNHINAIRDELISLRDQDLHMGMIELIDKDDQTEELTKVNRIDSNKMLELEKELEKLYSSMDANNGILEDDLFCLLLVKEISHLCSTKRGYVLDGHPTTVDEARKIFNNTNSPQQIDIDKLPDLTVCFKRNTQPNPSTVVLSSDENILNISSNDNLERRSLTRRIVFSGVNDVEKQNSYEISNYKISITPDVSVKPILKTNDSSDGPTRDKFKHLIWDEQEHDNILKMLNNHYVPTKMIDSPYTPSNLNIKILKLTNINQDFEQILNTVVKEIELIEQYEGLRENTNLNESNLISKIAGKRKIHELERLKEKMTLLDEFERATDFEYLEHISSEVYLKKYVTPTLTKLMVQVAKVRPQNPVDFLAYMALKENPEGLHGFPAYSVNGVKVKNIMERMFRMCGYSDDAIESNSLLRLFLVPSTSDDGEETISEE